jgi:hypothetical protein
MHPSEELRHQKLIERLVAAARSIITYQVGLPVGCVRVANISTWLNHPDDIPPVFRQYVAEAAPTGLPLGSDRLEWNKDSLAQKDVLLRALNAKYEPAVMAACWRILELHSPSGK